MDDKNSVAQRVRIDGLDALGELAFNLHWSWNPESDWLWKKLDPKLWVTTHNPWLILQTLSRDRLKAALSNTGFPGAVDSPLSKYLASYHYTARIVPDYPQASVPLEADQILWQR